MKKSILAIALIAITAVSCKSEKNKVTANQEVKDVKKVENVISSYKANISESTVTWKGNKPTGSHNGTVSITKGLFEIENNVLKSGEFVIDMNSILCADLEVADGKEKLENHLKGSDFFDVKKFPTAKFEIANSEVKDGKLQITGNLTLRGTTKSITIPATVTQSEGVASIKSDIFSIDRTDFGVTYKSKKIDAALKDKFINDLLEISFNIKAKK